jgi:hypothetical protein
MKPNHPPAPSRVTFRLPSATVIPFPCTRRIGAIRKLAASMHAAGPHSKWAEGHLRYQLECLAECLQRLGVPLDQVAHEWRVYEHAVRCELERLQRVSGTSGGAA